MHQFADMIAKFGYLGAGSIKFVGGLRTKVLAKLAKKIGKARVKLTCDI